MAMLDGEIRKDLATGNSGVCRCGAVFDYGSVVVPLEDRGLCGRCAAARRRSRRDA
jgi:hypothetical protein